MNKKRISIITLIMGLAVLVVGVVFLIIRLTAAPSIADGEYLVSIGEWAEADEPGVVWNFTEIGKGTLTTNSHLNDYDFVWVLDDGKLQVQTDWLYTLDNTYEYTLDQGNNTLTLTADGETVTFTPAND